mgnify:CR=1 FL=1
MSKGTYVSERRKKLIETSLPLEAINAAASREKSIRHGHPSTLHLYWSRKPLAATRAVWFAQLVDDPASRPDLFPTEEDQERERERLHRLIEDLVIWENSNNEALLKSAKEAIKQSNNGKLPVSLDPFAGGGSVPLEAQRLGLTSEASDLNPLAVLLNKAMIEYPPKFDGWQPVHPGAKEQRHYQRAQGLAEDIRYYGQWMRDQAWDKIGHLYPTVTGPDGEEHTVIAWKWARTVQSPNPANRIETPLVSSWWLSKRKGNEAWIKAEVKDGQVTYEVQHNANGPRGEDEWTIKHGKGAKTVGDKTPFTYDYVREEGLAGRMGSHLIAVVAEGPSGRLYCSPDAHQEVAEEADHDGSVAGSVATNPRWFSPPAYGLTEFSDLFTNRQLVAMTTFSDLVAEVRERVLSDALESGLPAGQPLEDDGDGANAYANAVATYLTLGVSRLADRSSSLCSWDNSRDSVRNVFGRQAIPMIWDFAEPNPFSESSGNFLGQVHWVARVVDRLPAEPPGLAVQADATSRDYSGKAIQTDPPYYDNIGYSDLSDFFYVWLRRSLHDFQPDLVRTMLTPKAEELVANPYRHGGREEAQQYFIDGFNQVFAKMREQADHSIPLTLYYAYKQQDAKDDGKSPTGWHTLLDGLIDAGWQVTATWPMRSELTNRMLARGTNALASSIVLACRPRPEEAPAISRRQFVHELKRELPEALRRLMEGGIAPVDLAQAAIGPGISVFSRYSRVREADGNDMSVRDALLLINSTLDEVLDEQESDFDPDTRFAVKWYRQYGWGADNAGIADQLARSSDTSLGELERGETFEARGGKARLLSPRELEGDWDPETDKKISVWEATIRLAAVLNKSGAEAVADLLADVGTRVDLGAVKELGFLLYHDAEDKGRTQDALLFNGLVTSWGDLKQQAERRDGMKSTQGSLDI